jgi:hypothetical protein
VEDTLEIIQKDLAKPKVNKKRSDREAAPAVTQEPKEPRKPKEAREAGFNYTEKINDGMLIDKEPSAPNSMGHGHFKIGGKPVYQKPSKDDDMDDLFLPQNE